MKTVLDVIAATTDYFTRAKIESPRLNIEHLLAHVLRQKRMDLYMQFDRPLTDAELDPLRSLVKRRAAGEPLQYLLGTADFLTHSLLCDPRALIPRPETEQLCEHLIAEGKSDTCPWLRGHIVDVGTGSGCIAIALASAFPEACITAADISEDAVALARENAARCGFTQRINFIKSDLLNAIPGPIHLLVANLPYIPTADIPHLQAEVLREPLTALDGGPDGLSQVRSLIAQASTKLSGRLALELHLGQPEILAAELATQPFHHTEILKDHTDRFRFLLTTYG